MAISFDAVSPDTSSNAVVANITSSAFTVAGANRLLIGAMGAGAGTVAAHNAMKWGGSGGTALTQVGTSLNIGANARLSAWRLIAPTAASQTLYGEFAATQDEVAIGGTSYTGVDQTTPLGTAVTNTGTFSGSSGFNATITVTTVVGDVVWAVFWVLDGNGNSPLMTPNGTPSGTGRYEIEGAQLTFEAMQIQEVVATGTSTVVSCAVAPTSGTMTGDWGGIAFVVNSASGAPPPAISSTSTATPQHTGSMTITGTNFGASQGAGNVKIGGVSQTVTSWADTSITVTVDRGVTKYGVATDVVVTDNSAASSSPYALSGLVPQTGWSYTDITTPFVYPWLRLSSAPDIASGDQVAYESNGSGVTVYADATFSVWNTISSFQFEVWSPSAWGTAALQEVRQPWMPAARNDAADAEPLGFIAALNVENWAAVPVQVEKWFADELSASSSAGSHPTTGALSAQSSTIAGTATHLLLHTSTGALSAQSATIAGAASHQHAATGALSAQASTLAGSAAHLTLHTSAGALSAQAAAVSGAAQHQHAATGVLTAQAASVSGSADHTVSGASHSTSGALTAQDATVAGSAVHLTLHATTGALAAQSATVSGAAVHPHTTAGALSAQTATVVGAAAHAHAAVAVLIAQAATMAGVAARSTAGVHDATGALQAQNATINGDAQAPVKAGGSYDDDKPKKKRWLIKVGEQTVEVGSLQQATKLLDKLDKQVEQAETAPIEAKEAPPPVVKIIERPTPQEVKAEPQIDRLLDQRIAQYNAAAQAVARLIEEMDDEEAILMLL